MPPTLKELRKITAFCRKNGLSKLKTADFEIELAAPAPKPHPTKVLPPGPDDFPDWNKMTEEQQLLWSSTPIGSGL